MSEMRILTVRQPWAHAIIHLGKDVENRVRNIAGSYRGPVAIHAAKAIFEEEGGMYPEVQRAIWFEEEGYRATDDQFWEVADAVDPNDPRFLYGAVLGVVDLVGVHHAHSCPTHGQNAPWPLCSAWAESGDIYHLVLANPRPLTTPIPYRGALGLRRLNPDTITRITAALAAGQEQDS